MAITSTSQFSSGGPTSNPSSGGIPYGSRRTSTRTSRRRPARVQSDPAAVFERAIGVPREARAQTATQTGTAPTNARCRGGRPATPTRSGFQKRCSNRPASKPSSPTGSVFSSRFPDVHALATADLDDVLGAWAGLGYYSRARNLQAAARLIDKTTAGNFRTTPRPCRRCPESVDTRQVRVASIAFDRPEPVLDGNVKRVLARLLGIRKDIGQPATLERLWEEAGALAQRTASGRSQPGLDGAGCDGLHIRARPAAKAAPCRNFAMHGRKETPNRSPSRRERNPHEKVEAVAALVVRRGKALAVRRPFRGLLGGLWDLPGGDLASWGNAARGPHARIARARGLEISRASAIGTVEHVFTHRKLTLHVYRANTSTDRIRLDGFAGHKWLAPRAISSLPHASVTAKALDLLISPTAQIFELTGR